VLAGCCTSTVYLALKKLGIAIRSKSEAISRSHSKTEYRENAAKRQIARYEDPIYRQKVAENLRRCGTDPEIVKRRAATLKATLADPIIRSNRIDFLEKLLLILSFRKKHLPH